MKNLSIIALAIASMSVYADPIVTGDPAACGTDPFPAINSPDYRIECKFANPYTELDPAYSRQANWYIVTSNDPHAQDQIKDIEGITAQTKGAYIVPLERQAITKGDNNNLRAIKAQALNPNGGEGNDSIAVAGYTQPAASINPNNPNKADGIVSSLIPNKSFPVNGNHAFDSRTLDVDKKIKWNTAYNVAAGSAKIGMNLSGTMFVRGPRSYDVYDDKGVHTYECDAGGNNCQLRDTRWHMK